MADEPIEHKAFSVAYMAPGSELGRHAIVIAVDFVHAVEKAEAYFKVRYPGLKLVELRLEDDRVIE